MNEEQLWAVAEKVMTDAQFAVFYLRVAEEMPSRKIAEAFRITRQAVDARYEAGRLRLAKALEELEEAA